MNLSPKKRITELFICLIILTVTSLSISYGYFFLEENYFNHYDFSYYKDGPKISDIINLNNLKDDNGKSLFSMSNKKLILLGVIDPECGASSVAKDQINLIYEQVKTHRVNYVFVSFTSTKPTKFHAFAKSLNSSPKSFIWSESEEPPIDLETLVVPSHILITPDGKVLKKFPGTNQDEAVRIKMAKQIIKETLQSQKD